MPTLPDDHSTVDARGRLVLPGAVDPHCHIAVPLGEFVTLDSFESASLAALAGGTTTIVDFAIPTPGEHPMEALAAKRRLGQSSRCDFALHGCIAGTPLTSRRSSGTSRQRCANGEAVHHVSRSAHG